MTSATWRVGWMPRNLTVPVPCGEPATTATMTVPASR